MNRCGNCHVFVSESLASCPLCRQKMRKEQDRGERWYPDYETPRLKKMQRLSYRICLFLSIALCLISGFINLLTYEQARHKLWFLYVVAAVLYLWLLIGNTILSASRKGAKLILQTVGISLLLYIIDANSGYHRWSLNWAIPFLLTASILSMMTAFFSRKKMWNEYIGYAIAMTAMGFLPVLLFVCKVTKILWPSAVCALSAVLYLIAMFVFSSKQLKKDLKHRFHY